MIITGKYNELLKEKAIKEASEIIISLKSGNIKEVYETTQLSWRKEKSHFLGLIKSKPKLNNLDTPQFEKWEIQRIDFHSMVMIDVYVKFESKGVFYLNRVRMIAEKKPYVTHPDAKFRYNPNSIRLIPAQPLLKH